MNKKDNKSIDIPKFINYEDLEDNDSFLDGVNSSLSKQVNTYFEEDTSSRRTPPPKKKRKKKKTRKLLKLTLYIILLLAILTSILLYTGIGKKVVVTMVGNYIYSNLDYQSSDTTQTVINEEAGGIAVKDESSSPIINILLIGVEEFEGAKNTDSMMIATMNMEKHTLKLTSIMRDLYVQIPGYKDNKLNSAYPKGGIDLLYQTINLNFGIKIDGYCLVNFDAFEKIIDIIGKVEITLTSEEAHYLNTTNYISKKANRHVVMGPQLMNGNQALGYCRVRKVSTGTENNDFGRTQRQRVVLEAIYEKVKSKNVISLVLLMNDILTHVKIETDITQKDFNQYLEEAANLKVKEIDTFRIPTDGSFDNASVPIGSRNVSVLVPKDWNTTRNEIHTFIYGKTSKAKATK